MGDYQVKVQGKMNGNSRNINMARTTTRILALAFCFGLVIGGSLPELGNLTVYFLWGTYTKSHYFNIYFLLAGILGMLFFGFTLYRRLVKDSSHGMVK